MVKADTESRPKDSVTMDFYGDAARQYMRSRTAQTCAWFFLAYLKPGMTLLDCGCGEGTITVDLAAVVAPGQVVGVDVAANAIQRARQLATERGLSNVRFEQGSVYDLPYEDDSFDAVFSHGVFEHLTDKAAALREIRRVLKPGGIVGLRASDLGAKIVEPIDPLVEQYWDLFARIRDELGGDSIAGRRLRGLLSLAEFTGVTGSASFETFGTSERLQWYAAIYGGIALNSPYTDEWLARGWIEREALQKINGAFHAWALKPGAFAAHAFCEAIGWKS